MKSTDLRAKARAIFGSAVAEPMPKQPNGAKALQQRANARPIPTYKVGGVVKKNDGGLLKKPVRGRSVTIPLEEEKLQTRRDFAKPLPKKQPKVVDFEPRRPKTGKAPANAPKPPEMTRGPDITVRGNPPTKPGREEAMMEARRAAQAAQAARRSPEADDVLMTTRRGQQIMDDQKRREMRMEEARRKKQEAADKLLGIRMKDGGKACGAMKKGGKVQTSADTAKKLATEMGGMKKGGKAKDGLAVMIAIGKVKKPVKKAAGGTGRANMRSEPAAKNTRGLMLRTAQVEPMPTRMQMPKPEQMPKSDAMPKPTPPTPPPPPPTRVVYDTFNPSNPTGYKKGGAPVKKAVGGAGKTRKGMAPIKKAQGGAAKVRKGMMSETGNIKQVVKPKRGIGGM